MTAKQAGQLKGEKKPGVNSESCDGVKENSSSFYASSVLPDLTGSNKHSVGKSLRFNFALWLSFLFFL